MAYVGFAIEHRGHFEVMFRPEQLHRSDPELRQARVDAREALDHGLAELRSDAGSAVSGGERVWGGGLAAASGWQAASGERRGPEQRGPEQREAEALAAWALVHGMATLWLSGSFPRSPGDDPEQVARAVAAVLFQ